jgi:hypothetical protein
MRTHCSIWPHKNLKFCVVSVATAADLEPTTGTIGTTLSYTRRLVSVYDNGPSVLKFRLRPTTPCLCLSFLQSSRVHGNRTYMRYDVVNVEVSALVLGPSILLQSDRIHSRLTLQRTLKRFSPIGLSTIQQDWIRMNVVS